MLFKVEAFRGEFAPTLMIKAEYLKISITCFVNAFKSYLCNINLKGYILYLFCYVL